MSAVNKIKRRRDRASVVCSVCKRKKIKCDRQKPCSNCIKSSQADKCTYDYEVIKNLDEKTTIIAESPGTNSMLTPPKNGNRDNYSPFSLDGEPTTIIARPHPYSVDFILTPDKTIEPERVNILKRSHDNSILDVKFDVTSQYMIMRKPSRTIIGMNVFSAYNRHEHLLSVKFFMSFKNIFKNERSIWKLNNFKKSLQLHELQYNSSGTVRTLDSQAHYQETDKDELNPDLNDMVEKLVCNNYYAILERLGYFQTELNKILFNSYIPMGVVQLIFHYYFNMKREGIVFNKPKKIFEYSLIALITSLVELTNIFTKFEPSVFNFPLPQQNNEFNELSVMLLNASNYRKKCSIFGVYTLLNLRLSLMIYGDAQSPGVLSQNTYPFFQSAANMCIEMGINMNQDKVSYLEEQMTNNVSFVREIPIESVKKLWNYLLILDSSYYAMMGVPPLIDDRFSYGYYMIPNSSSKECSNFVSVVREVALIFNGIKPRSFRELYSVLDKVTNLLANLQSFRDFCAIERNADQWILFSLKFKLLRLLSLSLYHLYSILYNENLAERFSLEVLNLKNNQEIIEELRTEITIKCKLIYFIAMNTILEISNSNLQYKFLHYIRDIFSSWIGIEAVLFMDLIVTEHVERRELNPKNNYIGCDMNVESQSFPPTGTLPVCTKQLEDALYDFNTVKHAQIIKEIEQLSNPKYVAAFMSSIYEKLLGLPILISDYKFFVMTKLFLIGIYFLNCYIKVGLAQKSSTSVFDENFNMLKDLTKSIIKKHFQKGQLTHLISTDQILKDLKEPHNPAGNSTNNSITGQNSTTTNNNMNSQPDSLQNSTEGYQSNWVPDSSTLVPKVDDIATAMFDDQGMMSIFKDIDQFFSKSM